MNNSNQFFDIPPAGSMKDLKSTQEILENCRLMQALYKLGQISEDEYNEFKKRYEWALYFIK